MRTKTRHNMKKKKHPMTTRITLVYPFLFCKMFSDNLMQMARGSGTTLWLPIFCLLTCCCLVVFSLITVTDTFIDSAQTSDNFTMDASNVRVELLSKLPKTIRMYKPISDNGVPFNVGDMVDVTSNNDADHTEGTYVVVNTGDSFIDVCEAMTCTLESIGGPYYQKSGIVAARREFPVGTVVYFTDLQCYATVGSVEKDDGTKSNITILKITRCVHETEELMNYECYGNTSIVTRDMCQAQGHVWDRRCAFDYECPFFGRDTSNLRGGCNNGYCEFPIAAQRLGYTKYTCDGNCDRTDTNMYDDNNIIMRAVYKEPANVHGIS